MSESPDYRYFHVEKIIGVHIGLDNEILYHVQWSPTWEPLSNLSGCDKLIKDFWTKKSSQVLGVNVCPKQEEIDVESSASSKDNSKTAGTSTTSSVVSQSDSETLPKSTSVNTEVGESNVTAVLPKNPKSCTAFKSTSKPPRIDKNISFVNNCTATHSSSSKSSIDLDNSDTTSSALKNAPETDTNQHNICVQSVVSLNSNAMSILNSKVKDADTSMNSKDMRSEKNCTESLRKSSNAVVNGTTEKYVDTIPAISNSKVGVDCTSASNFVDSDSDILFEVHINNDSKKSNDNDEQTTQLSNGSNSTTKDNPTSSTDKALRDDTQYQENLLPLLSDTAKDIEDQFSEIYTNDGNEKKSEINCKDCIEEENTKTAESLMELSKSSSVNQESPANVVAISENNISSDGQSEQTAEKQNKGLVGDRKDVPEDSSNIVSSTTPANSKLKVSFPLKALPKMSKKLRVEYKPFHCLGCHLYYQTDRSLQRHCRIHHQELLDVNEINFHCSICKREFLRMRALEEHVLVHVQENGYEKPPFGCGLCDEAFDDTPELFSHTISHVYDLYESGSLKKKKSTENTSQGEAIICKFCSMSFKSIEDMGKHVIFQHMKNKIGYKGLSPEKLQHVKNKLNENKKVNVVSKSFPSKNLNKTLVTTSNKKHTVNLTNKIAQKYKRTRKDQKDVKSMPKMSKQADPIKKVVKGPGRPRNKPNMNKIKLQSNNSSAGSKKFVPKIKFKPDSQKPSRIKTSQSFKVAKFPNKVKPKNNKQKEKLLNEKTSKNTLADASVNQSKDTASEITSAVNKIDSKKLSVKTASSKTKSKTAIIQKELMKQHKWYANKNKWECKACSLRFLNYYQLTKHKKKHKLKTKQLTDIFYQCPLCPKEKPKRGAQIFNMHCMKFHSNEENFPVMKGLMKCPSCVMFFPNKRGLSLHMCKMHDMNSQEANEIISLCVEGTHDDSLVHNQTSTPKNVQKSTNNVDNVSSCSVNTSSISVSSVSNSDVDGYRLRCRFCSSNFSNEVFLSRHERSSHKEKLDLDTSESNLTPDMFFEFMCHLCYKSYPTKANLLNHARRHHETSYNDFTEKYGIKSLGKRKFPEDVDTTPIPTSSTANVSFEESLTAVQALNVNESTSNNSIDTKLPAKKKQKKMQCDTCPRQFNFYMHLARHLPFCEGKRSKPTKD